MEPQAPVPRPAPTPAPAPAPQPAPTVPVAPQPVAAPSVPQPAAAAPPPPIPKKRFPTWLKVIIGIVVAFIVLIIAIIIIVGQTTKGAAKVSDQFMTDVQSNKPAEAYQLASPDFRDATDQDKLTSIINSVSPALQGKYSIVGRAISKNKAGSFAVIAYKIDTSKGTKYARVTLKQQSDGTWQVETFQSSNNLLKADYLTSDN
jgi:hypothetical protein